MVQVARAAEDTATAQTLAYMYLKRDGHLRLRTVLVVLELFPLAGQSQTKTLKLRYPRDGVRGDNACGAPSTHAVPLLVAEQIPPHTFF